MNLKKINFKILYVILYFFEKFEHVAGAKIEYPIKLDSDTPEKQQQIEKAYENLSKQVSYRFALENKAAIEAENQKKKYQEQTHDTFSETKPPNRQASSATRNLWNNAKKAVDKYKNVIADFEHEEFCESPSDKICKRAFKNSYFKKENLIYDDSQAGKTYKCPQVGLGFKLEDGSVQFMIVQFKLCWAKNEKTKASVTVYLQSAYKQPFLRKSKFFVLYAYIRSPSSGAWTRTSDPARTDDIDYRYEAYVSLSWF